ncbi:hypothetical protein [Xenorhabdus stockiae]|uniref:hypothetical protein n=1 Tax=Xenorhabdus stockiae TaxID=351614 RepID=UPI004062902C
MKNKFNEETSSADFLSKLSQEYTDEIELADFCKNNEEKSVAFGKIFKNRNQ